MGLFDGMFRVEAMRELLERERRAILEGQIETLGRIATQKERLLELLAGARLDEETLDELRARSERNAILLEAMKAGIANALERVRTLRAPQQALSTYDQSGQKKQMDPQRPAQNRRA